MPDPWEDYLTFDDYGILIKDDTLAEKLFEKVHSPRGDRLRFRIRCVLHLKDNGKPFPGKSSLEEKDPLETGKTNIMCPC